MSLQVPPETALRAPTTLGSPDLSPGVLAPSADSAAGPGLVGTQVSGSQPPSTTTRKQKFPPLKILKCRAHPPPPNICHADGSVSHLQKCFEQTLTTPQCFSETGGKEGRGEPHPMPSSAGGRDQATQFRDCTKATDLSWGPLPTLPHFPPWQLLLAHIPFAGNTTI